MDISFCNNTSCPLKHICLRQTGKPGVWQSYAMFHHNGDECDYFLIDEIREKEILTLRDEVVFRNSEYPLTCDETFKNEIE